MGGFCKPDQTQSTKAQASDRTQGQKSPMTVARQRATTQWWQRSGTGKLMAAGHRRL